MGRPRRITCRSCDRAIIECGPLSSRGLCSDCGVGNSDKNARELARMEGESTKRWRARTILSLGGILPNDLKEYGE